MVLRHSCDGVCVGGRLGGLRGVPENLIGHTHQTHGAHAFGLSQDESSEPAVMSGSPSDGYARPRARLEAPPAMLWVIASVALIPFPASALMYCYGPIEHRPGSLTILFTWSSIILSFIAGVRWGLE